jgi:ubiquinone/menaquinone biosynthesis C-methylase UbiE
MTTNNAPLPSARSVGDFDARAATWDDDPTKVERARAIADAILREVAVPPACAALEYGAGTGLLGFMLRDRLADLTLADVSEGMLEVARRKIEARGDAHARAIGLDLLAGPVPSSRYDFVFSAMTLHHIPDTAAILRRFHDVLRPGGTLAVADLDTEDGSFHGEGFDGHRGFDRDALGALARAAGFSGVRFVTAHTVTKVSEGASRKYPVFLLVATA